MDRKRSVVKGEEIRRRIEEHNRRALQREALPEKARCRHCKRVLSPDQFKYHGLRRRSFLVEIGDLIEKVSSWLVRLKCCFCKGTFTVYPEFALPYKRYTRQQIEERSAAYLEDPSCTYMKAAGGRLARCGYEQDERQFAGSTVWRWITYLGGQVELLRKLCSYLAERFPQADFHRLIVKVSPKKARTEKRRRVLESARRLLHAWACLRACEQAEIFTDFATDLGVP